MKRIINYRNLIINPENYRFDSVDNQEQAIDLMIEEKGQEIFNMAKHILVHGLDGAKDLRVLEMKGNKYLVLDGNRRMVAIKCLHNPELIKDKKLKENFNKILKSKTSIISDIQCFVYKDEKTAADWIKLDHTGKNDGVGQDSWGSPEKDRFGYKFEGKISPAMQTVNIVEKELNKKIDTKRLKISTINRILSNPDARSFIGVNVDKGNIIFTCDKKETIERLNKLFDKIINDKITVGSVYHTHQIFDFISKLYGSKPVTCKKPELPIFNNNNGGTKDKTEKGTLAKHDWITFDEYTEYVGPNKIKHLLNEMRQLDPKNNANILMPALRVLLELSLYYKLEEKSYLIKIINNYKSEIKNGNIERVKKGKATIEPKKNWSPTFREMLHFIIEEQNDVIKDPKAREALEDKMKKEGDFIGDLNNFIHNVHNIPAKDDPEKTWRGIGRLLFSVIKNIQ